MHSPKEINLRSMKSENSRSNRLSDEDRMSAIATVGRFARGEDLLNLLQMLGLVDSAGKYMAEGSVHLVGSPQPSAKKMPSRSLQ
jgi:hypothetical protein